MLKTEGFLSESVSVLAGGVTIWLGDSILLCGDLFHVFLDPGCVELGDGLKGLGGMTDPYPFIQFG